LQEKRIIATDEHGSNTQQKQKTSHGGTRNFTEGRISISHGKKTKAEAFATD
jgi:hypothetical protein